MINPYCRKESTTTRKFPHPAPIVTTPIKHFFKAPTTPKSASTTPAKAEKISIATPSKDKISIGTPVKTAFGGSPKGLKGLNGVISPKARTPAKSPKEVRSPLSLKSPESMFPFTFTVHFVFTIHY